MNNPLSIGFQEFSEAPVITPDQSNDHKDTAASRQSTLSRVVRYGHNECLNSENDVKRLESIEDSSAAETVMDLQYTMPVLNMVCTDQSPSFAAKTAETPTSLMSSFDTLNTPKDDIPMNHGFPSHGTNLPVVGGMMPQHPQSMSFSGNELWAPLQYTQVDAWRPQWGADPAWSTAPEDLYSGWHDSPNLIAPAMDSRSSSQPYTHLSTNSSSAPIMGFPDHKNPTSLSGDFSLPVPQAYTAYQGSQYNAYAMQAPAAAAASAPMSLAYLSNTASEDQIQPQGWTDHNTPSIHGSHISSPEPLVRPTSRLCGNAFLVECKRKGLSYKEIKRIGGFKEAESTLRGRYRTLTKSKDQRVRKPKWSDADIQLLCEGVDLYTEKSVRPYLAANAAIAAMNTSPSAITTPASVSVPAQYQQMQAQAYQSPKIPWKKVSEHISANGGSYQFGNATCKKKWYEIHDL
ncbi:hypothetical protein N7481_000429 [Penicillium waksmanii]|uniref:uncharacterized protein n=1 Tax=Penicillium waksmanii TaxID=69791 RepID=UPI002547BE9E|nr:uncharacterized protein N7481_000429 [Penicillium waksmanii]KAJ6000020.1 hypothetical protein N7481_000429 [Penicillium waksmanii]